MDSSSDEETEIQNVELLNSVLEADREDEANEILSQEGSRGSATGSSTGTSNAGFSTSKIEVALALNKMMDQKLKRLESVLIGRFHECRKKLMEIQGLANNSNIDITGEKQVPFLAIHCGKPYFKDKFRFPAPDNNDTLLMRRSGLIDMAGVTSVQGWTVKDKRDFLNMLLKQSKSIKKKELHTLLAQYQRQFKSEESKEVKKKIKDIRKEVLALEKKNLTDLALPIDQEYDWDLFEAKLSRHSASEYRAMWKLFLHPTINKAAWNKHDHCYLQNIAQEHGFHDWEAIAQELNTGRTGYQVFVYFRTNMNTGFVGKKWTKDEEEFLKRLVDYFRQDDYIPWTKIAPKMQNRTKLQIYNKYLRFFEKKGRFLPEEDAVILTCIDKFGTDFKQISQYLNGRSTQQIRNRYYVLQKCNRISSVWTLEEDRKLIQLMANNDSVNYAQMVKFFPGKDRANIRSRYITLVKWMRLNPKKDISKAPRRGARRLRHGKAANDLSHALAKLKNRMESELKTLSLSIKKNNRVTEMSSEEAIEQEIIITLINENLKDETEPSSVEPAIASSYLDTMEVAPDYMSASNLRQLLLLMRAQLDKEKFKNKSDLANKYPTLLEEKPVISPTMKVRSYSKTNKIQEIKFDDRPDIWGNFLTEPISCCLPPSLATITGCKQLMSLCSAGGYRSDTYSRAMKKNVFYSTEWNKLIDRVQFLLVWPMILSNRQPFPAEHYLKPLSSGNLPAEGCRSLLPITSQAVAKKFNHTLRSTADTSDSEESDTINMKKIITIDTFQTMNPYSTSALKPYDPENL